MFRKLKTYRCRMGVQLFGVIQGHAFADHRKAVEWLNILYVYPL